jgi:hypothetical protein
MKLSTLQIERALDQIEAQPVPEDHPVIPQLIKVYGEHTFFLDDEGLEIIEMASTGNGTGPMGQVIKLASWADQKQTTLATHEPEATEVVVVLGSNEDLS